MDDEADVGLVDAHAERDGRDHDQVFLAQEALLVSRALLRLHAGVVGQRGVALAGEPGRRLLDHLARKAVDDAAVARVGLADEAQQLLARLVPLHDGVADVGPVEAADERAPAGQPKPLDDVLARRLVGRRGERDARHAGKLFRQHGELRVLRPEIVTPGRDAVRLVDGEERHLRFVQQREKIVRQQPLRRDVDEIERALAQEPSGRAKPRRREWRS